MAEAREIAWGYVTRDIGNGRELLVAKREKQGDKQRKGQLVIPGGGLEEGEDYVERAIVEVYQETGIRAVFSYDGRDFLRKLRQLEKEWDMPQIYGDIVGGVFHLSYKDSGKSYIGKLFPLVPEDATDEPEENPASDARKPEYMPLQKVVKRKSGFTPACQILLAAIREVEGW